VSTFAGRFSSSHCTSPSWIGLTTKIGAAGLPLFTTIRPDVNASTTQHAFPLRHQARDWQAFFIKSNLKKSITEQLFARLIRTDRCFSVNFEKISQNKHLRHGQKLMAKTSLLSLCKPPSGRNRTCDLQTERRLNFSIAYVEMARKVAL
jgi:hypothetical protein